MKPRKTLNDVNVLASQKVGGAFILRYEPGVAPGTLCL